MSLVTNTKEKQTVKNIFKQKFNYSNICNSVIKFAIYKYEMTGFAWHQGIWIQHHGTDVCINLFFMWSSHMSIIQCTLTMPSLPGKDQDKWLEGNTNSAVVPLGSSD